jgi:V/A-type H+-transporting ATPase subunit I
MFRPEEMSELSLLVLERDVELVMQMVARQGVLHQLDMSYLRREQERQQEQMQDRVQHYQSIEQRVLLMLGVLQVPEQAAEPREELSLGADQSDLQERLAELERDVMPLVDDLKTLQQRVMELDALEQRLGPLIELDIDLGNLRNLTFLHAEIGIAPTANLERLKISLSHVPHILLPLREEGAGTLVALFGSAKDYDILDRAAHSAYFSPVSLPEDYRGTPEMILNRVRGELAELGAKRELLTQQVVIMAAKWGGKLQALLWRVRADLVLFRAMERFGRVRDVYLIAGWVPNVKIAALVGEVKRATNGRVAVDVIKAEQTGDPNAIPISLGNRGILRAFEGLVTNYAWPTYGEIDPTPLVALTFCLFFGIMFGDVGHGFVLALAGFVMLMGWLPALKQFAGFAPVLLAIGFCSMAVGVLDGSIFGMEHLIPALWMRPLENIMTVLLMTVVLGVVVLLIGFVINMINGWLARDWRRIFFDRYGLAGLWFYGAVLAAVVSSTQGLHLPAALWAGLIIPPALLILVGEPLGNLITRQHPLIHESIGLFAVQAVFEFLEALISYLSNSLSFVRLGAFAVAHAGLSSVVIILAEMAGGASSPFYWIVLALGNVFIIGFEGLIVSIQTLRLEYYEFFSKFFTGGGLPYRPLTLSSKKS